MRRRFWSGCGRLVCGVAAAWALAGAPVSAGAGALLGDLNGDGRIDTADEDLLRSLYGAQAGDPLYDPVADANGDGVIDVRDLAGFGAVFGATGGNVDTTPPGLLVTLNDIPDDMNDLLVVPPELFHLTFAFASNGGSLVDPSTLSVVSSQDIGAIPAGTELAPLFSVSPTRAFWEVPAGSDLARASHYLTVSIADLAGNVASDQYGFAVRDFAYGAPLATTQLVHVDFDQDRSMGPEVDFLEDLREYGLSTAAAPAVEAFMRDWVVSEILTRMHAAYGIPGPDPVNIAFSDTSPGGTHSRICIGGESSLGANFLGATTMDVNNLNLAQDECFGTNFGIFPQAIDNLWDGNANYLATFTPLDPDLGGTPAGAHALDATVLTPSFDPDNATTAQLERRGVVVDGVHAFAQALATVAAHEVGHMVGLVAHGAPPAGLYGGTSGSRMDHNETPQGQTPVENFIMNAGNSFTFDEIVGLAGYPVPTFRPLAWAYLRGRIALNSQVTALLPPPQATSVQPNPVSYSGQTVVIHIYGQDFNEPPLVDLIAAGDPTPNSALNASTCIDFCDADGSFCSEDCTSGCTNMCQDQVIAATLNKFVVPGGATYDVQVINPDGQTSTLSGPDALVIQ